MSRRCLASTVGLVIVLLVVPKVEAGCASGGASFGSLLIGPGYGQSAIGTPGTGYAGYPFVSSSLSGSFWAIGFGDPAIGSGVDNGSFEAYAQLFGLDSWVYVNPYYLYAFIWSSWSAASGIDGCIDDLQEGPCMAVALSDQNDATGYFALLAEPRNSAGDYDFAQESNATILLDGVPRPQLSTSSNGAVLDLDVTLEPVPPSAIYSDDACSVELIAGYRVYQQAVPGNVALPEDRVRDDGDPATGWQPAVGGLLPGGLPVPLDQSVVVPATDCSPAGRLMIATTLVLESGFELGHVSANGAVIDCGACSAVDLDGDGFRSDRCETRLRYDCDDANAGVYPGAAQVCDGVNNDCSAVDWPNLDNSNELDDDGDGVTGCEGDPCPFDADDDGDGDGFCADVDTCPDIPNPAQVDTDADGIGDVCDACPLDAHDDTDMDGLCADVDNCPNVPNRLQSDVDGDGLGDVCDACPNDPDNDIDGDHWCGDIDPCPFDPRNDLDDDSLCADVDPCPSDADNDIDQDDACGNVDNCPLDFNPDQADVDADDIGDACDDFDPPVLVADLDRPNSIDVGDVDRDGDIDVLVSASPVFQSRDDLSWFENLDGLGTSWAERFIEFNEEFLDSSFLGDVDVDGDLDAVARTGDGLSWWENFDGGGVFWEQREIPTAFSRVRTHDLFDADGDGDRDLLVTFVKGNRSFVGWLENTNGQGLSWADRTIDEAAGLRDLDVADVDGDGDADLLGAQNAQPDESDSLVWFERVSDDGSVWRRRGIASGEYYQEVLGADVDLDGDLDAISIAFGYPSGLLYWHENLEGDGTEWAKHFIAADVFSYDSIVVADFDRDLDLDLGVIGGFPDRVLWYENRLRQREAWRIQSIEVGLGSFGPDELKIADFDGDGDPDLLSRQYLVDDVEWFRNTHVPPIDEIGNGRSGPLAIRPGSSPERRIEPEPPASRRPPRPPRSRH
ncbi:MAG: hypothetical protein GY716_08825 [bacterium]|nr:hypothetical protein [bacterium]